MFKFLKFVFIKLPAKILRFAFGLAQKTAVLVVDSYFLFANQFGKLWVAIKIETKILSDFLKNNKTNPFKQLQIFLHNYVLERKTYIQRISVVKANQSVHDLSLKDYLLSRIYRKQFLYAFNIVQQQKQQHTVRRTPKTVIDGEFEFIKR